MADGSPQSIPVWIGREGEHLIICTGEGSLKAKKTRRDPRVALSVVDFHKPYEEVQIRGRVIERRTTSLVALGRALRLRNSSKFRRRLMVREE